MSKMSVDNEGHLMPATFDDAGGCPLASIFAGSSLSVVVGADTVVSACGV